MFQQPAGAQLLIFPRRSKDWSPQELAEFYRVENALTQSGLIISSDRGISDEGDPWFVFFRVTDHEPLVHFARIDDVYIIASAAYDGVARGKNFREMILDLLSRHRLNNVTLTRKSNIFFHPAALLITLVGVSFFKTPSPAKADDCETTPNLETIDQGTTGVTKKKELSASYIAKSSTVTIIKSDADGRLPMTTPPANDQIAEMTSILLSAIAELSLMDTAVAEAHEDLRPRSGPNASEVIDTTRATSFKISSEQQPAIFRDDLSSLSTLSPELNYATDTHNDLVSTSDAFTLLALLNSIPVSSGPINLRNLFMQSKEVSENIAVGHPSSANSAQSHAETLQELAETTLPAKTTMMTINNGEKAPKELSAEHSKIGTEQGYTVDSASGNAITATTINLAQIIQTDHKLASSLPPSLALAIVNEIAQSFRFSNFNSDASVSTNEFFSGIKDDGSFTTIVWDNGDLQKNVTPHYILTVVDDIITLSTAASYGGTGTTTISNNSDGGSVESLLTKFLQTFTKVTFTLNAEDEFVFRTMAGQSLTDNIEQIMISFEDGSNINIIGQKQEIVHIMSWI